MGNANSVDEVLARIEDERLLALERAMLRIPSPVFEEGNLADFLAEHMAEIGLEVEMMEVTHPDDPEIKTRQAVGRLSGTGGGPTLMLNGHMDPAPLLSGWTVDPFEGKFEDGWVWGSGAHDDKGGLTAALTAVEAVVRAGARLAGDVLVCPVAAHKHGGIGTRTLLKRGVRADCCINMEHSTNTIATTCTGSIKSRIVARSTGLFFRYSTEAKARYFNAIEQQAEVVRAIGPSLEPADPDGWITYEPHPDLPGYPMHRFDAIHKEHYLRDCALMLQVVTVPGQTIGSVRADIENVLAGVREGHPNLDCEVEVPAGGADDVFFIEPMETPSYHPLVVALAEGQRRASGREPEIGGVLRVGNYGDGNILGAAGIPSVQYGPGDIRIYAEWPAPDERVELRELVEAAHAIAYAICRICN